MVLLNALSWKVEFWFETSLCWFLQELESDYPNLQKPPPSRPIIRRGPLFSDFYCLHCKFILTLAKRCIMKHDFIACRVRLNVASTARILSVLGINSQQSEMSFSPFIKTRPTEPSFLLWRGTTTSRSISLTGECRSKCSVCVKSATDCPTLRPWLSVSRARFSTEERELGL